MAQFPQSLGTSFAVSGFSPDPNLSPNNQGFAAAVLACVSRAGLPFGFETANTVLAGPASGSASLPSYRALAAADVPGSILPGGFNGFGNPTNLVSGTATNGTSTLAMRQDATPAFDFASLPGGFNGFGNPTNKISGTATNGTSTRAMRQDATPALDWTQLPTWTALHTFNNGIVANAPASGDTITATCIANQAAFAALSAAGVQCEGLYLKQGAQTAWMWYQPASNTDLRLYSFARGDTIIVNAAGNITVNGAASGTPFTVNAVDGGSVSALFKGSIGVNNVSPPAQSTGWGTPVGGAVILNYNITDAGGANSNTNKALAQLIAIMKAIGFVAA